MNLHEAVHNYGRGEPAQGIGTRTGGDPLGARGEALEPEPRPARMRPNYLKLLAKAFYAEISTSFSALHAAKIWTGCGDYGL